MRDTFEMAREAGLDITCDPTETPWRTFVEGWEDQFKAFEALVRADEREECAKVCDERYMGDNNREDMEAKRCAAAIRNRGNT
jgi:hypothetical protein